MCPEALELGYKNDIPTFAICHFTWDWFFYQTIPLTLPHKILDQWKKYQKTQIDSLNQFNISKDF